MIRPCSHRVASSDPGASRGSCNRRSGTASRPTIGTSSQSERYWACKPKKTHQQAKLLGHAPHAARRVPGPQRTARSPRTCRCGSADDGLCASTRSAYCDVTSTSTGAWSGDSALLRQRERSSSPVRSLTCAHSRCLTRDSGTGGGGRSRPQRSQMWVHAIIRSLIAKRHEVSAYQRPRTTVRDSASTHDSDCRRRRRRG